MFLLPGMTTFPAVCVIQAKHLTESECTYALKRARTTTRQKFLNLCSRPTMNSGLSKYGWFSRSSSSCTFLKGDICRKIRLRLRLRFAVPKQESRNTVASYTFSFLLAPFFLGSSLFHCLLFVHFYISLYWNARNK